MRKVCACHSPETMKTITSCCANVVLRAENRAPPKRGARKRHVTKWAPSRACYRIRAELFVGGDVQVALDAKSALPPIDLFH
jgi:hypothetical protein